MNNVLYRRGTPIPDIVIGSVNRLGHVPELADNSANYMSPSIMFRACLCMKYNLCREDQ